MTVSLTVSKTIGGSAVADSLTGGDSGYDFGETETSDASPPEQSFFIRHNGTFNITNFAVNVQAFAGTYGGDYSASADLTKLISHGDSGYGLQVDFRWDGSPLFGTKTILRSGVGVSYATRITIPVESMSFNDTPEVDALAPVAGRLGASGDANLGDTAHMTLRYVNPTGEVGIGRRQFDTLFSYNFSS